MAEVILVCSEPDRVALDPVVAGMEHSGLDAEVWSGLEVDAAQLATRMDGHAEPALYVLCMGRRVETALPALIRAFEARRGPDDMIIKLKDWREDATAAVANVLEAMKRGGDAPGALQSAPPSRFGPGRERDDRLRAHTYGRQHVPDNVVARLAEDHAARSSIAPAGPAPLPGAIASSESKPTALIVAGLVLVLAGIAGLVLALG
jgi:hypothetical protein